MISLIIQFPVWSRPAIFSLCPRQWRTCSRIILRNHCSFLACSYRAVCQPFYWKLPVQSAQCIALCLNAAVHEKFCPFIHFLYNNLPNCPLWFNLAEIGVFRHCRGAWRAVFSFRLISFKSVRRKVSISYLPFYITV